MSDEKIYDQQELDAAVAAAYREAAKLAEGFEYYISTFTQFGETKVQENPYANVHTIAKEIRALITPTQAAALEKVIRNEQDRWIAAFGAQDLVPRVTPESLANWVFQDVQQQLDGLNNAQMPDNENISKYTREDLEKYYRWTCESLKAFRDKFGVSSNSRALDAIDAMKSGLEKVIQSARLKEAEAWYAYRGTWAWGDARLAELRKPLDPEVPRP